MKLSREYTEVKFGETKQPVSDRLREPRSGQMALLLLIFVLTLPFCHAAPPLNAGLPASFDPAPNYPATTDDGDVLQLSDGELKGAKSAYVGTSAKLPELLPGMNAEQFSERSLWGALSTVGWMHTSKPILISFDLESPKRIGGLKVHSAAGTAGVFWPAAMAIVGSNDGKNWSYAGELISRSRKHGFPPSMGYSEHQFVVDDLNLEARYIGLCVDPGGSSFFFTDEIEVLPGDPSKPADVLPVIGNAGAVRDYVKMNSVGYSILRRLALDYSFILSAVRDSAISAEKKTELEDQLRELDAACNGIPQNLPEKFRTVIPINDTETRLLSIYGSLLRAESYEPLLVSKIHRNAYLGWLTTPAKTQEAVELSFRQMRDEARGDLLLLTNSTPAAQKVALAISPECEAMSVFYCPWTDTPQLEPVATALLPAARMKGGWQVEIPPGLTMKVWVSVDGSKLPVGKQDYKLSVAGAKKIEVVVKTDISPVAMGPERLYLGMWDLLDGPGSYNITPKNRDAAIGLMRSHGVDSAWGHGGRLLPWPKPEDFDKEDNLVGNLDFSAFDAWLTLWSGARRYMVAFPQGGGVEIAGVPSDSPRFPKRVKQWARALADHAASKGLRPGQLQLLIVDEPSRAESDRWLVAWAKPIKEEVNGLLVWSDPVWKDLAAANPEAFSLPDTLCPNWSILDAGGNGQWDFYQKLHKEGKPMELYMCSALAPHTDPNRYYRLMPWAGWKLRIQGIGFWSFGDQGGVADAWSAYQGSQDIWYAPAFLGETDATDTLQWQAVREGVLDYEYLRRLEKRLPEIKDGELKKKAEHLLSDKAIEDIFRGWTAKDSSAWHSAANSDAPDIHRQEILAVLEKIDAEGN